METDSNSPQFASLAEAVEAFGKQAEDLKAANALAEEASNETAALKSQLEAANTAAAESAAKITALETAAIEAASKIEQLTAQVGKLEAEAKTAEQKAAEIAANSGTDPVAVNPGGSSENHWEKYQAIKDPAAKTAYWRANMDAIISDARKS